MQIAMSVKTLARLSVLVLVMAVTASGAQSASYDSCAWTCYLNGKSCRDYCRSAGYPEGCGEQCNQGADWCYEQCEIIYF